MMNDLSVEFSIDTVADVTVVPEHVYQQVAGRVSLQATSRKLYCPGHHALSVIRKFIAKLKKGQHETEEIEYVVSSLRCPLLGRPAIESLKLLKRISTIVGMIDNSIKQQFPMLYTGLRKLQGDYHIF